MILPAELWMLCPMEIHSLSVDELETVLEFWKTVEGVGLSRTDTKENLIRYMDRNPGMSYVAASDAEIVGTALCGHDGRRGYIHHLAIAPDHRGKGIGKELAKLCLDSLRAEGIDKCHIFVFGDNLVGQDFWHALDWQERSDIKLFSHDIDFPGQ